MALRTPFTDGHRATALVQLRQALLKYRAAGRMPHLYTGLLIVGQSRILMRYAAEQHAPKQQKRQQRDLRAQGLTLTAFFARTLDGARSAY